MSNSGKAGSGRGNSRRRSFRRRGEDNRQQKDSAGKPEKQPPGPASEQSTAKKFNRGRGGASKKAGENSRQKWASNTVNPDSFPVYNCLYCGKPIRDLNSAIADRDTEVPIHFDCVASKIGLGERLEKGESIAYIGGGRFGIISFGKPDSKDFKIKKIIEWEDKEKKAEWRSLISEHYSQEVSK
ncbi:MAG: hypothetical protein FWG77_02955 [Treponema sp.]|nr:hypothetical protein [Treponema sp.]